MTRTEHLLTILAEECAEVAQRATKALRFGLSEVKPGQSETNAEQLVRELVDLRAVVDMLEREGALPVNHPTNTMARKRAQVEKYLAYSASLGLLAPPLASDGSNAVPNDSKGARPT